MAKKDKNDHTSDENKGNDIEFFVNRVDSILDVV